MQFLALLGLRPWLIIAGVAAFALMVGGPMFKAQRLQAELSGISGQLAETVRERNAALTRAASAETNVATLERAVRDLAERERRAREAVWSAGRDEQRLRTEVAELRRQLVRKGKAPRQPRETAHCSCDGLGDALDVLRDRQSTIGGRAIP